MSLPLDRARPPVCSFVRETVSVQLGADVSKSIRSLASEEKASPFDVLMTAYMALLFRYTSQTDLVIGSALKVASANSEPALVPLRIQLTDNANACNLVRQISTTLQKLSVNHQRSEPGLSLFNTTFLLWDAANQNQSARISEAFGSGVAEQLVQCDLVLATRELNGEFALDCEFDAELFEASTVERFLEHFRTLLAGMVSNPAMHLSELPLLSVSERHKLLVEWNDTRRDYPLESSRLHKLIEAQVKRTPDAVAVVFESEQLSYRALNERANQLAHFLRKLGVGPDGLVGICVERSVEMVVGLLGILKAGGAYVPLDPQYPRERLAFMMEDAGVPVLLTQKKLIGSLPQHKARVICLDADWNEMGRESTANPNVTTAPDNLAYMIYTSGSTGKPKGAMNTHCGICNRLLWMQEQYQLTSADAVMQKTPFSFDVSVWEFFWPLLTGARLVVARPGGHQDPAYLVKLIEQQRITVLHFVPSMLRLFLDEPGLDHCTSVRHVICSGEALPFDLQERFFESRIANSASLHNLYGPTEAAVDVTHWTCRRDSDRRIVPLGRPVANTTTYILDSRLQPVPIGVPGELHLGGVQIGRGYHNRPELTVEKFIPDPFTDRPGARLYKTGDLARYLPDGNIEFLGRMDHQVKIRGFRIELGEIESRLAEHDAIKNAVVVAREPRDGGTGDQQLIAYLVSNSSEQPRTGVLKQFLLRTLPDHMVPSAFVWLKEFPLSPNGKVDRKALPAPSSVGTEPGKSRVLPRTEMEKTLAVIWQKALGVEQVGAEENFFELGGNSLLLVRIQGELRTLLNQDLTVTVLFQYPTISSLASYLSQKDSRRAAAPKIRQRAERQIAARLGRIPLAKERDE